MTYNMKNQVLIQVKGMGVPVQAPTARNADGFEIRWSSDADISPDCPVHVLSDKKQLERFVQLAVDDRFRSADLIQIIPVVVPDGSDSLTREQAINLGADPENWNMIRVAMVISGNSSRGPIMDEIEWAGTREEHAEGAHMQEAYEHAHRRKINHPSIFSHNQGGHLQKAASFMNEFQRQMKPSLRAAEEMTKGHERALLSMDLDNLNPDRALFYLKQMQTSLIDRISVQQLNVHDSMKPVVNQSSDTPVEAPAESHVKPSPGPRFH
ncbi:hypothetical protein LCGC14_0328290 [marine sediment metagenome]|uniref:Uncharacterized protein n=1 Tax=marine sediment metagenome TaxID=412755 RepID=A0A0F9THA1_9ZZZZ